jgi:hypothetical protein
VRRGAGSVGFLGCLVTAVMFAAACGGAADPGADGPAPTSNALADEVSLPQFGPFDTGVLTDISIDARFSVTTASQMTARLDACEHVAPGRWLLRGDMTAAPHDATEVLIRVSFDRGDMSTGVGVRATVSGRGRFTLPIDLLARDDTQRVAFWAVDSRTCSLELGRGAGDYADVIASKTPLDYRAPAGTVQALGIGARMDQRDAKFAWAYFAWSRLAAPFADLWIPPPAPGPFRLPEIDGDSGDESASDCAVFSYSVGETIVRQSAGCRRLVGLSDDPVPGADGYHWQYESADRKWRSAVLFGDSFQVVVSDSNLERLESVAASLEPVRSLVVASGAQAPSFAEVVEAGRLRLKTTGDEFGVVGDLTERARIRHGDVTTVVYTGHYADPCDNCEDGLIDYLDVYESNGRWRVDVDGGGSFDDCLSISAGWSAGRGVQVRAVTGDPRWTIDVVDVDVWAPVHTVDGVWIQDYPTRPSGHYLPRVVVRDETGKVVPCRESAAPPT